jgi:hypothetical protein
MILLYPLTFQPILPSNSEKKNQKYVPKFLSKVKNFKKRILEFFLQRQKRKFEGKKETWGGKEKFPKSD